MIYEIIDKVEDKKFIITEIIKHYNNIDKIKTSLNYDEFKDLINNDFRDKNKRFQLKKFYNKFFNNIDYNTFKDNIININNIVISYSDKTHYKLINIKTLYETYFIKV